MSIYNKDTELIFPSRVIPKLKGLKGELWDDLIIEVVKHPNDSQECMAFVLMMAKIGNCINCSADSFRAMRGCTQCAQQNISRHKDTDKMMVDRYNESFIEIDNK